MVQLRYSVLAFAFTTQLVWAFPKPDAGSTIQQRGGGPNDQFVFAICPRSAPRGMVPKLSQSLTDLGTPRNALNAEGTPRRKASAITR